MQACLQAPHLNMHQHGESVHHQYKELLLALGNDAVEYKELRDVYAKYAGKLPSPEILERYHIYHDCGKHLCLTIDEATGKRQFPNHAEISSKQYATIFPEDGFTKQLIAMDMDFHILRGDDLLKTCRSPFAPILYFTAWAEVNANAEMFGGRQSESYKIKRSRLIQAGKKLLNHNKENNNVAILNV
jgi:hypothetical protein